MLTTDFSGTYDYEREEGEHAAQCILGDLYDGYLDYSDLPEKMLKERQHWKKCLPDTFDDWNKHFTDTIEKALKEENSPLWALSIEKGQA